MTDQSPSRPAPEFGLSFVRDVSEAVYRERLSPRDLADMIAKDGDPKVRERAGCFDVLTRVYLRVLKPTIGVAK
jgi:hypothetical protein